MTPRERFNALAAREWAYRRQNSVRELGAYLPVRPQLPDVTPQKQAEKLAFWEGILTELAAFTANDLPLDLREDIEVLRAQVEVLRDGQVFLDWQRPFHAFTSFWGDTAAIVREERTARAGLRADILSMLADIPRYFDENIENMREGLRRGFSQPARIMGPIIGTAEAVLSQPIEEMDYFKPFLASSGAASQRATQDEAEEARRLISTLVLPAYAQLAAFLKDEYLPAATDQISAAALPQPEGYYAAKLRAFTSLNVTPDEIYQTGLQEVAATQAQMQRLRDQLGYSADKPGFHEFLRKDPQFYARDAEELLCRAARITKLVDAELPRFFGKVPRQRFAIEPVPDSIAAVYPPGTGQAGLYLLNTSRLESRPLYLLPVLTLHEADPGHCFQMALAAENDSLLPFRAETYAFAYGNAWALYCEKRLGTEMGIYRTPYELYGAWSFLALRAVRMVVDVGVHHQGWSYERALAYMLDNTSLPEPVLRGELDRYISWPGQATAYYLGMMAIEAARARAETALGAGFDLRAFHDHIMQIGPVPMSVLCDSLDRRFTSPVGAQA